MPLPRHYPKAPITEALIDIRVELPEGTTVRELETVQTGLESVYPTRKQRHVAVVQAQVGRALAAAAASSQPDGVLLVSGDEKQVFQARLDGFTFSRLAPYEEWDTFRSEARRLWDVYRCVAKPAKVTRLAVRYINRLDLPMPVHDLKEYLRTVPEVSPDLPQDLAGCFMQLRIQQCDLQSCLLLTEAIIEPAKPGVASVVLDIDVFRVDEVPTEEKAIWSVLEELRGRKNEVFEACITDKARELFV